MEFIQKKFPYIPPNIIFDLVQKYKSIGEIVSLLENVFDKKKSCIIYDQTSNPTNLTEKSPESDCYEQVAKKFPILSSESIRIIIESSNYKIKESIKNAKDLINSYQHFISQKGRNIDNLNEKIFNESQKAHKDELTFLIKINGSNLRTTMISLKYHKRLQQIIDNYIKDGRKYSYEHELSDDEWSVWGDTNESNDDEAEDESILNPVNRLNYLFPIIEIHEVENVYNNEAKQNYGVAYRILRERSVLRGISMEFPSATDEEIRDAIAQADGDEEEVEKIILLNKIENPVIEEKLLALRPDLTMQEAREAIKRAQNPNDARELLDIANNIYPLLNEPQTSLNYRRSEPIQTQSFEQLLQDEESIQKKKKLESFSKAFDKRKADAVESSAPLSLIIQKKGSSEVEAITISIRNRRNISLRRYGPTLTLDLHGMRKNECEWFVENVLDVNKNSKYSKINFITGKGKHSFNKIPVLRPLVMEICEGRGLEARLLEENKGVVQVILE